MIDNVAVGLRIRGIRKSHEYTMVEFANVLKVEKRGVWCWENGVNLPNKENLQKISSLSDLTTEDILYGDLAYKHKWDRLTMMINGQIKTYESIQLTEYANQLKTVLKIMEGIDKGKPSD